MSDPSAAVARAMASVRGKRTGVLVGKRGTIPVEKKSGMEDMDKFWEAAKSPPPEVPKKQEKPKPLKQRNKVIKPRKRVKPRFSLPNSKEDNANGKEDAPPKKINKFLARVVASDGTKPTWSPSDLSGVSTAPPTPAIPDDSNESPVGVVTQADEGFDNGDDTPISPPEAVRASPEEARDQSNDLPQDANDHQEADAAVDAFNANQDDGFVEDSAPLSDDDDLMPPPPPEETVEDVDGVAHMQAAAGTSSPGNVDFPNELGDDDDGDGDKEGAGFSLVHDPETPESVREERLRREREELEQKAESKKKKSKKTPAKKSKSKKSKATEVTFSSPTGYPAGNRDYEVRPVSEYKESTQEEGVRRSKRAKFRPLDYWRNEKLQYEAHHEEGLLGEAMGNMPVVTGVVNALPTPYKKRKAPNSRNATGKAASKKSKKSAGHDVDTPFDDRKLRKKYDYADNEVAHLWDDALDESNDMVVISRAESMKLLKLPLPKNRRKQDGKVVGEASQAFNIPTDQDEIFPGYIMGKLVLPPKGLKDHESVGGCSQTFTVCQCQPNAVEVAYANPRDEDGELDLDTAERFLLGPGDMFRVPPGNTYRIQNHSKTTDCYLAWTIIRPRDTEI